MQATRPSLTAPERYDSTLCLHVEPGDHVIFANGHYNYFGVNGDVRSLARLKHWVEHLAEVVGTSKPAGTDGLEAVQGILQRYPLPRQRLAVQIWER